ncbi:hypothetical protein DL98DRAFT_225657 [Cadophora sp. DSE1049]|nr:hypothetical protein DL98DRAFT_225657 [Cadophora sp. DSE1049]
MRPKLARPLPSYLPSRPTRHDTLSHFFTTTTAHLRNTTIRCFHRYCNILHRPRPANSCIRFRQSDSFLLPL